MRCTASRWPSSATRSSSRSGRPGSSPRRHSLRDELAWLEAEGPTSPALVNHIKAHEADYDFFIFFSFRYHHSFHGCRAVASKAILVPTAERDGALGLGLYPPVFRGIRAFMYNSYEERALIHGVSNNQSVPGVVVGIGSEIPERTNAGRFRQKFDMRDRFAIYVGRIDENKGCAELFEFFEHYSAALVDGMHLVLVGSAHLPIPAHPRIHHVGFLEDQDKYDAMAAAELLIMPSYLESLSMVALEAWALGKPVLANAKCDVLQGQCLRSNAGLFYANFHEFAETLGAIDSNPVLQAALGRNGRAFFEKHYSWPVIEKKYVDMLQQLSKETPSRTMEPMPGWFGRRRRSQPPADSVVKQLPTGPYARSQKAEEQKAKGRRHATFDSSSGRAQARPLDSLRAGRRPGGKPFDSRSHSRANQRLAQDRPAGFTQTADGRWVRTEEHDCEPARHGARQNGRRGQPSPGHPPSPRLPPPLKLRRTSRRTSLTGKPGQSRKPMSRRAADGDQRGRDNRRGGRPQRRGRRPGPGGRR